MKIKSITKEFPFFFSLPAVVWQLLFVIAPMLIIFFFSITTISQHLWWQQLTLQHYRNLFNPIYFRIIFRSLILGFSTAVTCLMLAYPVAYFLALHVERFKTTLLFLLTLPFWVNFLVQIYAWYFLLERNGLFNTIFLKIGLIAQPLQLANSQFAVYLVMVYCYLPFMIMPLYNMLEKVDKRLLEASADLGATPWQTFTRITVPISFPAIRTGLLLVLVPAFGEFVIPSLLGGGKYMMVGTLISYFFLVARNNGLGAAFTTLSGIVLLLTIFIAYRFGLFISRSKKRAL